MLFVYVGQKRRNLPKGIFLGILIWNAKVVPKVELKICFIGQLRKDNEKCIGSMSQSVTIICNKNIVVVFCCGNCTSFYLEHCFTYIQPQLILQPNLAVWWTCKHPYAKLMQFWCWRLGRFKVHTNQQDDTPKAAMDIFTLLPLRCSNIVCRPPLKSWSYYTLQIFYDINCFKV